MTSQDDTATREVEFKQRFAIVLQDLQAGGKNDAEAMWMLGTLAADLAAKLQQTSWSAAKSAITTGLYDELLATFQAQGNAMHQAGQTRQAYAIQTLAISLVAGTQRADSDIAAGEELLDALVDQAVAAVLASRADQPVTH